MTDNSLLQDFIVETGEHLEDTERNLLRLEQQPDDANLLNDIFRSIHTIKGSSEYLGLERVAELSHKLENLLDLLRRKERTLDSNVIDLLINTNDRIATLVDDLAESQEECAFIDDLVSRIDIYTGHAKPVSAEEALAETSPQGGDEIEDEFDEELFGIFIDQLKDGLQALMKETQKALSGDTDEALITRYEDRLGTLRSSANYMGYDKLKEVYVQWAQPLAGVQKQIKAGDLVDWGAFAQDVTAAYIDRVKRFFPKVSEVQEIDTAFEIPEAAETVPEPISEVEEQDAQEELRFDDIGIDFKDGLQPDETGSGIEAPPELALFSDSEESVARAPERTDNTLLHEFIIETGEHLEDTERNLLRLEQEPRDVTLLNDIFRSIHTIKGSSEYLGLDRVAELSHKLENLLDLLRRGEREVTTTVVDLLIGTNDRIAQLVDDLAKSRQEKTAIDDLVTKIDAFADQVTPPPAEEMVDTPPEPEAPATQEVIDEIDDEYDQELFGIFVEQLKDGLTALLAETRQLKAGNVDTGQKPLAVYEDRLDTLKSSANYMGYDSLRQVYAQWAQAVANTASRVAEGQPVDWDLFSREVTFANLQLVAAFFPKISEVQILLAVEQEEEAEAPTDMPETAEVAIVEAEPELEPDDFATEADQGLLGDFIAETGEHLDEIEQNLLLLKNEPEGQELLKELFRSVHTIKGSSEYLGMLRVAELSHKLEGLLDVLRRQERMVDADIIDLLIDGHDRIAELVEDLAGHGTESAEVSDLTDRIDALLKTPQQDQEQEPLQAAPAAEEAALSPAQTVRDLDETYDKELFDIFMEQFNSTMIALEGSAKEVANGQDAIDNLTGCKEKIQRLRSSANYMEYDDLRELYNRWSTEIERMVTRLKEAQPVDLQQWSQEVMTGYIKSARRYFEAPGPVDEPEMISAPSIDIAMETVPDATEEVELPAEEQPVTETPEETIAEIEASVEPEVPAEIAAILDERMEELADSEAVGEAERGLLDTVEEQVVPVDESIDGLDQDILEQFSMDKEAAEEEATVDENDETLPLSLQALVDMPMDDVADLTTLSDIENVDDQSLLARLESAFDANIGNIPIDDDQEEEQIDLVRELLSGEEEAPQPPYFIAPEEVPQPRRPVIAARDIESMLFSDASKEGEPQQASLPKPLARPTKKAFQRATGGLDEEDRRSQYNLGRRQSDSFRERLVKQNIRVDAAKIDTLMNQVGELVVTRAGFSQLFLEMRDMQLALKQAQRLDAKEMSLLKELTNRINEATVSLGRVTSELQENVMKVRMLPIAQLFSRYPRVVHDLVRNSEKKVELSIFGEETELDRMVIEQISDPLVHIIRNAVDHGIEEPEDRQRSGKSEGGTIRLEAYHEGNYVVIEISDDGRGIDTGKIRSKALINGFAEADELEAMSDDELLTIIMRPGFSTADEVTHTSGRGVGMDVVKDNIEKLNGTIDIENTPGRGTLFRIKIPLTLAIIQALMVRISGELFTIPLSAVDETIRIHANEISTIEGMEVYYLRETTLPLIRLARIFKMPEQNPDAKELFVVVVNTGNRQVGLVVDQLQGREEVVIKPLEDYLQEKSGFSGATILGDGSISLILDVSDVVHLAIDQHMRKLRRTATL